MSGVIDGNGQQWEYCNGCGKDFKFPQNLGYEPPSPEFEVGRMLCLKCANASPRIKTIQPAPNWRTAG